MTSLKKLVEQKLHELLDESKKDSSMMARSEKAAVRAAEKDNVGAMSRQDKEKWIDAYIADNAIPKGALGSAVYSGVMKVRALKEEVEGSPKRNRELYVSGRISKDEFDRRMKYGKYKEGSPRGVGPLGKSLYKNLVKNFSDIKEEADAEKKYIVKANSHFWKTDHYVNSDDPRAHILKRHIKHASPMTLENATKIAKEVSGGPNNWKTEIIKT
jgi:hypothetical protein